MNSRYCPPVHLLAWIILTSILVSSCAQQTTPQAKEQLELKGCVLSGMGSVPQLQGQCATLPVYEDPAAGQGRQINLHIVVLPAVSRNPQPDPLFFLAGGPGQAATETFPLLAQAFQSIRQKRDIVLVDQRGTGKSNPLNCAELEEETLEEPSPEVLEQYLQECITALDADVALYTTANYIEDLEQVRAALGYEQVNLYGVSYGSRVALTYLQQHPDSIRAVILDGVVPQDETLGINVASDAQRALDLILKRCSADEGCQETFPELEQEMASLFKTLQEQPAPVSLAHPTTGIEVELDFTADMLANAIRLLTYTPETVALLPLLLHAAYSDENYDLLAAQYLIVAGDIDRSINNALSYSILCSEDVPFLTAERAEQANQRTYLGNSQTDALFQVCDNWPQGEIPAGFKEPVHSEKPVLLLSGEYDPVTPPENAEQAAQTLTNHLQLVAPEQGHNVVYRGCLPQVITEFIESARVKGLNTACIEKIRAMPFFLSFTGPQP